MQAKKTIQRQILFAKMKIIHTIGIVFYLLFMAQITHNNFTFVIIDEVQMRYPELVDLVIKCESITDPTQKQYWLDIIPSMTNEQIDRLFNILMTERQELERIELQFYEDVKAANEKHMLEWQTLQSKKAKERLAEAEKNDTSKQDAEDALGIIDSL